MFQQHSKYTDQFTIEDVYACGEAPWGAVHINGSVVKDMLVGSARCFVTLINQASGYVKAISNENERRGRQTVEAPCSMLWMADGELCLGTRS